MARTPKRVVERNLLKVPVLIEDTVSYSKYFEVSRLNPNFHAGKNGFLIRGTQYLKNGTSIQVEVLDRYGKTVFSNVIGNYSEGDARLVSVEITQKTRKGPGKLVVVGTATNYEDGRPIPSNQQNRPNVRWVFPIDIDASRRNTSKLILQNTPAQILNGLSVTRTDFNTTSRTDAFVTSSTYTASLDYDFEGHRSDGYAITMLDNSGNPTPFFDDVSIDGYFTGSLYKREISNLYDTGVLVPDSQSIVLNYVTASVYTPLFKTLNETLAITEKSIKFSNGDDYLNPILRSGSYSRVLSSVGVGANLVRKIEEEITSSVIFEYPTETLTTSTNNSSILNFRIPYTQTHTGEIAKVRISAKEANPEITAYQLLTEFSPGERNILVTGSNTGNVSIGRFLTNDRLQNYWQSGLVNIADYENSQSANPITLVTSSAEILEGFYADHTESAVPYYFGTQEFYQLYQGVQYTLKYDAVYNPTYVSSSTTYSTTNTGSVKAYLTRIGSDAASKASSSVVIATKNGVTNTYGLLVDEVNTKNNDKGLYERQVNFTPERDGFAYLRYIVDSGFWNFSNFVITPAVEYGYNPDEIVVYAEDTILTGTTYIFKIEFIGWAGDISDEFISDPIDIPAKGGGASLRLITDRTVFTFNSDGDPFPTQQTASVDVLLTNVTNTPTFTLVDDLDVPVDTQFYSASNGNLNFDIYVGAFGEQTGSLGAAATSSLLLTVSASAGGDIVQDKLRFVRAKDAADGTPGAPGADGEGARSIKVTLSDYSVVYEQGGINPTPTSITASATAQNLEGNQYVYNFYRTGSFLTRVPAVGTTTDTSATASFLVPLTDDYKQQNIEVQVSESLAGGVARDVEDFVGVTPGEDGWSIILTNTSHTLPADNDGNVSFPAGFVGSGTKIEVLKGANNLRPWTGSGLLNGYFSASVFESQSVNQPDKTGSVTLLGSTPTYVEFGDLNAMDVSSDLGSITFKIVAITGSNTYEFFQVQSFTKSQQGAPGSDGSGSRTTKLTLSDYSIVYDRYGLNPSPTSLTASAYHQNLEAPVTFSFYRTGSVLATYPFASVPPSPVTASFTTPPSDNYTSQIVEVVVSESANGVAFDNNEFYGVTPGLDGWTVILTNESHTFPANPAGQVTSFVGGGTDIEVLFGSDNLSAWTGSAGGDLPYGSFSASIVDSGSVNQPEKTGSVAELNGDSIYVRFADPTSMDISSDTGFITYEITAKSGSDLNPIIRTFTKKQSFTKSKEGPAGEGAYVYYITPLDGLQFKTNAQGTTTPNRLIFQTQRSSGSIIENVPSGSFDGEQFGLFFSGSNLPLSGSGPNDPGGASSYYTASADDIFERAVIRYLTGSGAIGSRYIADSVSVEDLTDGQDGITPILEVSGAITFNSSSVGILPTGTSSITGSLLRGGTSLGIISSSITPSSTTGFTVNAVGSSSVNVSSSWQLTADKDGTPIGYNFKFFSGSIGSYTQVGAQPFNINIDGKDGPPASGSVIFTVDPATQVICRDYNETITDSISPVVITATEGQDVLANNEPTAGVGEWNFIQVYGIPSKSIEEGGTGEVISYESFGGGAGGRINFDHTRIKLTGSAAFTVHAEIAYTSSLSITGSVTKSFTLTKQNCYDPCSPTVVELDRYNQTVNSITGSLQAPPENFKAIVTQDGDQLTYQSGVSSESTFDYLSLYQTNAATTTPTDNGDGTITPLEPNTLNTSEVHTLVRYKDNCGITATFPATHSINVIFEGAVGPGVVVTGYWTGSQAYVVQNNESGGIRDVVLWWQSGSVPVSAGNDGLPISDWLEYKDNNLVSYYAALKTHTSVSASNANSASFGPPHISTGSNAGVTDPAWEYLGDEERFVAAKVGIFKESFIWNTLNIGTNAETQGDPLDNVKANITLAGGTNTPYISIGQTNQDYAKAGTFIGSGSAAKLSLSGSGGGLFWDGSTLDVDGTISASLGYFYGGVSIETGGSIYSGQTAWNTGTGFWLESNSGTPRFSIGNSGGDKLTWNGTNLTITGDITVTGGNAATNAGVSGSFAQSEGVSGSFSPNSGSLGLGRPFFLEDVGTPVGSGLFLGSDYLGYYNNNIWSTYMSNTGDFFLSGSGGGLVWNSAASTLSISGSVSASAGYFSGSLFAIGGKFAQSVTVGDDIVLDGLNTKIYVGTGTYANSNTPFYLTGSGDFSLGDKLTWDGSALDIDGVISASAGLFSGTVTVGSGDRIKIGPGLDPATISPVTSSASGLAVRDSTPNSDPFTHRVGLGTVSSVTLGDVVEFNLSLLDIVSFSDPGPPTYYINGITDMEFGVTQSGVITSFPIDDYVDAFPYEILFTASYATVNAANITTNWKGTIDFNTNPGGASVSFFTSSLSASVVQPTLAISNDGIFFDRGSGKESLFSLSGGSSGTGGGGTTYSAGTGLDLTGTVFSVDVSDFMTNGANNRIVTSTGTDAMVAETNLTFDDATNVLAVNGSTVPVTDGTGDISELAIWDNSSTLKGDGNLTWNGTTLAIVGARDLTVNTDTLFVDGSADKVGINKTPVTYELDVAGTIASDTDVIVTSDIRLKNVESYVSGGLIIVNNLNPIKYTWKDKEDSKLHIGLSAQEVLQYVPEAVYGSEETQYGVSYGKLVPVLIDAVKELTTRIEELEKQLEDRD